MTDLSSPLRLTFRKATGAKGSEVAIRTFTSYSFDKNILIPSSPFRFTAPGIDKKVRTSIRSGDWVYLWAPNSNGTPVQISAGFIDETDTHVTPTNVDYCLTGRDVVSQLVDNSCVDAQNKKINMTNANLSIVVSTLLKNTRLSQQKIVQPQIPNAPLLFQTNSGGETKLDALQRYLEFTNCLVWASPQGILTVGKPNFTQAHSGHLILSQSNPNQNNVLEGRAKRNLNQAIRQIVVQLQSMGQVDPTTYTNNNHDPDIRPLISSLVGRSVYRTFSYGGGDQAANTISAVGNQNGNNRAIGNEYGLREIARDNIKVLDVDMVVRGHVNSKGVPYNIDQVYDVLMDDDDVNEPMYVYGCTYELTMEHGMLTHLKLCRLGSICAYTDALGRVVSG